MASLWTESGARAWRRQGQVSSGAHPPICAVRRTAEVSELARRGRVALGTDSRLSGSRDLLCEIRAAHAASGLEADTLESMVTRDAAALLRLPDRGVLRVGARADLLVLPDGQALASATRADVRLVMLGGRALYADADYARIVAPANHWAAVRVDGRSKMLERDWSPRFLPRRSASRAWKFPSLAWRAA